MPGHELVQSVLRAMDILELLAGVPGGLALAELCSRLGLKGPTVHNLLRTLAARHLVERCGPPVRYRLGPRLPELAARLESLSADQRCEGLLRQLVKDGVADSAHLARQAGGELTVVLRLDSSRPHLVQRPAARPLHPYASCAGLVFQAFCAPQQLAAFRQAHPFRVFGASVWASEAELEAELDGVREGGVCVRADGDATRVGVPWFGRRGQLEGVLGASGPRAEAGAGASSRPGDGLGRALLECSQALAAASGFAQEG